MEEIMAPDRECDRLRELLPQTQTTFVLPPISTIRKPPSAYCHPPSHTSGPPPGFFHYTSATAPILHPRPLFFSTYAQQLIPNQNPANAELEAGPASAAQEHYKRKAVSISRSSNASDSDSDCEPSSAADSEHDALSPSLSPSTSTPSRRPTDPTDPTNPSQTPIDDTDPRLSEHRWTCGEIRAKITRFIKTGEMKVNEFQRAIDVSSKAYYDFLKMSGEMRGQFSSFYDGAHRFFARREIFGIGNKNKGGDGEGVGGPAKK
ncbi:hypothetical protein BJX66DRAFT_338344 [Aspergillus keveii]|uniref:DUF7726 domain-containing protein n=1 Tax=Aspergillus keveii TaxID=714993 RepID=A0ABR4G4G5_9EURO